QTASRGGWRSSVAFPVGLLHDLRAFALPVAVALGIALVMLTLAFRESQREFHPATAVVEIKRNQCVAGAFDLPDELADFFSAHQ
ncbi:MAG: hypothetical protein RL458_2400, partial [Pseudomonadota bacterium]